jgi:hypothetical protein
MLYGGRETTDYRDGEVVFFIRIKGAEHFFRAIYGEAAMARLFGHLARRPTLSEYANADHVIDLGAVALADLTPADYDLYRACVHQDLGAVIARCRGLRDIPYAEARGLVLRMTRWAREFFRAQPYRLLVIHIIDNYVLDVLVRVARHLGRDVLVLSEWFIQPYRRHTFYGELQVTRRAEPDEVQRIVEYCEQPRQVFWLAGIDRVNRLQAFVYLYLRCKWLYLTRYLWQFRVRGREAYEFRFANSWKVRLRDAFVQRHFSSLSEAEIRTNPERYVLIPLHTFPEANVDYWMTDWRDADYYSSLYEVISFFRAEGLTVLLKEHPGFIYQRDARVYETLKAFDNVRLIDPFSSSTRVLDLVPLVVVWHGTMGIEGIMRGRRVAVFDDTYYNDGLLPTYRDYRQAAPVPADRRSAFIARLLGGVEPVA